MYMLRTYIGPDFVMQHPVIQQPDRGAPIDNWIRQTILHRNIGNQSATYPIELWNVAHLLNGGFL